MILTCPHRTEEKATPPARSTCPNPRAIDETPSDRRRPRGRVTIAESGAREVTARTDNEPQRSCGRRAARQRSREGSARNSARVTVRTHDRGELSVEPAGPSEFHLLYHTMPLK